MTVIATKRIVLVLGGGGLKGFAHIGVLRALAERGIEPSLLAGAGGRVCSGGGIIDNLPVTIASQGIDAVIAVDVGSARSRRGKTCSLMASVPYTRARRRP